jgi:hypothetical protein
VPAKAASASDVAEKRSSSAATRRTNHVAASAGASDGRACIICLEPDPQPIQSGCACRGDAGLAHIECRILAAEYKEKSSGDMQGWAHCPTCAQAFSSAMAIGLGEELVRQVQAQPDDVEGRCFATSILSVALLGAGNDAEAETVCRETMTVLDQVGISTVTVVMTRLRHALGNALSNQGSFAEAQVVFERCIAEYETLVGLDHPQALSCASSLGNMLNTQNKPAEGEVVLRSALERAKLSFGPEHAIALQCSMYLACALSNQPGKTDAALAVYVELVPMVRRVLGPNHPCTLQVTCNYAWHISELGRGIEAEAVLVDNLAALTRALGAEHPQTMYTTQTLARVRSRTQHE